jgi:predicted dehydrogenase
MNRENRRAAMKQFAGTLCGPLLSTNPFARTEGAAVRRPRIKIGQIGVGHGHANKVAVFRASPDYEVVGIVENDPELRRRAESLDAFRGLKWMTRDELLGVPGLEAVLVETHVRDLLENAEACVLAGKHIHFDKPAGESLGQFQRILDAAAKRKLLVQMGYMYRYNPGVVLLRELLKNCWLGDIFEVHAVMSKVVDPADRRELAKYPGGIMFELGCHVIDLVVGVLGRPSNVTSFRQQNGNANDRLLDNMLAVFEYPKALATVKSSAIEVEGFARRHLVVCGTLGTFHIQPLDSPSARLALIEPRGGYRKGYQDVVFPNYTRYLGDAADMARIIRGEKAADYSAAHDLTVQTAVLQASGVPLDS